MLGTVVVIAVKLECVYRIDFFPQNYIALAHDHSECRYLHDVTCSLFIRVPIDRCSILIGSHAATLLSKSCSCGSNYVTVSGQ